MQVKPINMWNFDDDLTGFAAYDNERILGILEKTF